MYAAWLVCGLLIPSKAMAASYDVTASVAYPAPTQASVFDPSLNNSTSAVELLEVFGTCQYIAPASIVVIYRGSTKLGSVNCEPNGTFRMNVTLEPGENSLIARISNVSGNYGPDSTPIAVTYAPQSSGQGQSTVESPASDLTITTPEAFTILDDENVGTIQVTVGGGRGPYTIAINWGDGTTESMVVPDAGTFSFRHTFESKGVFKVVATVTDVLGVSKVYQFIVTSTSVPATEQSTQKTVIVTEKSKIKWYVIALGGFILIAGLIIIGLTSFWLGRRYQYRKLQDRLVEESSLQHKKKG